MDGNRTVSASFSPLWEVSVDLTGTGTGRVTSIPTGISCPSSTCSHDFAEGTVVTLTAQASSSSLFNGWGGDCSGNLSCQLTMDQARSVSADFILQSFSLEVGVAGSGRITSAPTGIDCPDDCSESFNVSETVTLTATPDPGFQFSGWTGDCSGSGPCQVVMDGNRNVSADFSPIWELSVALTGTGSGRVTSMPIGIDCPSGACSHDYTEGTVVELVPSPASSSLFNGWGGDCSGNGSCQLTMDQARSVSADFILQSFSLEVGVVGSGRITSAPTGIDCPDDCSESFPIDETVTLTATPVAGAQFLSWEGDCTGTGACTVTMNGLRQVIANFSEGEDVIFSDRFE